MVATSALSEYERIIVSSSNNVAIFKSMLDQAREVAIFTGAGISTESGIPDFRSPTGIWTKMKPIQFQDFIGSEKTRQESWQRKFENEHVLRHAKPNKGHKAVAALVSFGKVTAVITQNIDNLHQDSGIEPEKVIELHGNSSYATCLSCAQRYELEALRAEFNKKGQILPCAICQGIIKTATISFGQSMPEEAMKQAYQIASECDFFIVLGSSLAVYPAASLPEIAKQNGSKLAIVNREPTPLDDIADLVLHDEIGATMALVADMN